ncbi:hypothetical protein [Bacillus halotolerans]|uniref:hypothetical protein n=1 Tax=Bacillus halotolerans TaxID=260554 RepID=UPI0020C2C286|nr:hypothetical protein [Bacillus halotolerans]MCY8110973.1 hypothetical protein [Bacillus spizizenii]UTL77898.1 hypothetical protein NLW79_06585 [Bacillus halotolerans]WJE44345.1 hypothetical protein QRD86_07210 [Bacillus halotolerans]WPC81896.1 hypothetical protein RA179_06600 [Bacillus halotolerans]
MKPNANVEIRYIEDLKDQEGKLLFKGTADELKTDGHEFDMSLGDSFTLGLKDGDIHVRVLRTQYDIASEDNYIYWVSKEDK